MKFIFLEDVHNFAILAAARPEQHWKNALSIRV
jgi:hypothetical protein